MTIAPPPTEPPANCSECPSDFQCYSNGSEYRWFVTGYVMEGFNLYTQPTGTISVVCGNVPKPTFLGKAKGDANCDGKNDISDYSLWHKEFYDGSEGSNFSNTWHADFTGSTNGVCDGYVTVSDYSLWQKFFYDLNGNK